MVEGVESQAPGNGVRNKRRGRLKQDGAGTTAVRAAQPSEAQALVDARSAACARTARHSPGHSTKEQRCWRTCVHLVALETRMPKCSKSILLSADHGTQQSSMVPRDSHAACLLCLSVHASAHQLATVKVSRAQPLSAVRRELLFPPACFVPPVAVRAPLFLAALH